jgi:hypothetical protein
MWKQSSKEHLSAEPLRASDAEIEEQKRAWELKRLATLTHDNDVIGFVKDVVPPLPQTPSQDDSNVYMDYIH